MPARPLVLEHASADQPNLTLVQRTLRPDTREPDTVRRLGDLTNRLERRTDARVQLVTTGDTTRLPRTLAPLVVAIVRGAFDRSEGVPGARAVLVCLHVGIHSVSISVYDEGGAARIFEHPFRLRAVANRVTQVGGVFETRGSAERGYFVGALLPFAEVEQGPSQK